MSTAIFLFLAIVIIFWHPPFPMPAYFKKLFRPLILVILMIMLLFIGALESYTHNKADSFNGAKNSDCTTPNTSKLTNE